MHKSLGNAIWFNEAVEKLGADVMRWMFIKQTPQFPLNFGFTPGKDVYKVLNVLFNTDQYVETYCKANNFKPGKIAKQDVASKWIISRLESLKHSVTQNLEEMKYHIAAKDIEDFFLYDFSRWYIHIIRSEVKPGEHSKNKQMVLNTLYHVMFELLRTLAPFLPFFAENSYQNYFRKFEKKESIHFMDWPVVNKKLIDKKLEEEMDVVKKITEACYSARQTAGIKLRWPMKRVVVVSKSRPKKFKQVLLKMCNTKKLFVASKRPKGDFAEAVFDSGQVLIDKKLDESLVSEAMMKELVRYVQAMRKKNGFQVHERIVLTVSSDDKTNKILKKASKYLMKEVGAKTVLLGCKGKYRGNLSFEGKNIEVAFDRA
jgi:isoleucyl-tRNA synthetase